MKSITTQYSSIGKGTIRRVGSLQRRHSLLVIPKHRLHKVLERLVADPKDNPPPPYFGEVAGLVVEMIE